MASKEGITNTVYEVARTAVQTARTEGATAIDPAGITYGFGTCDISHAGDGWTNLTKRQRLAALETLAEGLGFTAASAVAQRLESLFEATPDVAAMYRDRESIVVPPESWPSNWSSLPQEEFDRRMFCLDAARAIAWQGPARGDAVVTWFYVRAAACFLAGVANPFTSYLSI